MSLFNRLINKIKHEILRLIVTKKRWEYGVTSEKRDYELIVSLTSYPKRFCDLELCLKSLAIQSFKPNRIILWLGNDSDENDVDHLSRKYNEYGIEIYRDRDKNLFSHKKYYYPFLMYPESIIVTADDDLIYPADWLSSLYSSYKKHPTCISARRVHKIMWDSNNNFLPYNDWKGEIKQNNPSMCLLATTGAGTLFPPSCLSDEVLNYNVFLKYARSADDIWIKIISVLSNVKTVWAPNNMIMPTTINTNQVDALSFENVDNNVNDVVFRELCEYYSLDTGNFIE